MSACVWFSSWLVADAFSFLFNQNILYDDDNDDDNDDYYCYVFIPNLREVRWFQVLGVRHNHRAFADPSFCRFVFLFIPGQGAQAVSICPSDCSQGTAISGSQYNASPVPSEPTMQNANHNPSTCLPGWNRARREEGWERDGERENQGERNKQL